MGKNQVKQLITSGLVVMLVSIFEQLMIEVATKWQVWGTYGQTGPSFKEAVIRSGQAIFTSPILLLNVVWLFLFNMVLIFILNRVIVGVLTGFTVSLLATFVTYQKLKLRDEPVMPSDLMALKSTGELIKMLSATVRVALLALVVIILVVLVVGVVKRKMLRKHISRIGGHSGMAAFSKKLFKTGVSALPYRLSLIFVLLGMLVTPIFATGDKMQDFYKRFGYLDLDYNPAEAAVRNGAILIFLKNINPEIMPEPSDYSSVTMSGVSKRYEKLAHKLNLHRDNESFEEQSVLFVLSESLTKPSYVPGLETDVDVTPNLDRIMEDSAVSGKMISPLIGGGTANVEYMTLTGIPLAGYGASMATPYVQLPSHVHSMPSVLSYFAKSEVIHPYQGLMYNRRDAYKKLGIQKFISTDNQTDGTFNHLDKIPGAMYTSDESAFTELVNTVSNVKKSQFIQLMTMQNHLPYNLGEFAALKEQVHATSNLGVADPGQVDTYLTGIHETDKQIAELVSKLDGLNRPVTLVLYGDHWPAVLTNVDAEKEIIATHTTPYFIWQNEAAKKVNGTEKSRPKYIGPNDLGTYLLSANSMKVTPYQALLHEVSNNLPAIANFVRTKDGELSFVSDEGQVVSMNSLSKKQQSLIDDLKLVMFDQANGSGYLKDSFFENIIK